jgi:hypothetical protein
MPPMKNLAFVVAVVAFGCGGKSEGPATSPVASAAPSGPRHGKLNITKCNPVGYGFSCTADFDGTPITLEACVGDGDKVGLTPKITPPVALNVDVESAPESARYCGILVLPAGDHLRVIAVK